jgi:hypothetical protein
MDKEVRPPQIPSIPYADPRLPIGSIGYRALAYPSDHAGFWNPAQLTDDGNVLSLQPGPLYGRFVVASLVIGTAMLVNVKRALSHGTLVKSAFGLSAELVMLIAILIVPGVYLARGRQRMPWIVVDRQKQLIRLPRSNTNIPFADVVRLQLVAWGRVGFSWRNLRYEGRPHTGELQIVFTDRQQEQTWCVVAWPGPHIIKRFAAGLRNGTGIPISLAYRLVSGDWQVEAF